MSRSFTFVDVAGNQAQYTIFDADVHHEFRWSTDYGDFGLAASFAQAQYCARTVLKDSMAAKRRSEETPRVFRSPSPWRSR